MATPCFTFGTMLLSNFNNIIILKCNFCQKELYKLKGFLEHISRHIGGLNEADIGSILAELQKPEPAAAATVLHSYKVSNERCSLRVDYPKSDDSEYPHNADDVNEKADDVIDITEDDSPAMEDFIIADTDETIQENQVASSNDFDEHVIDSIEVDDAVSEQEYDIETQVYDDFIAEEQSLNGEYGNEVYLEPQINEDSNLSCLEDRSNDTISSNFLHESGSGFEVEFLEAKKSAIDNHNAKANSGFICMICKKVCTSRTAYQNHLKRHSQAKIHTCEICQAVFKDVSNLKVHRNRHLRVQPHACDLCDKAFTTTTELKIHKRSHTGEKPYICDYCGASYSTSSHLTSHRYRHFQIRRHKCNICDKAYFIKEDLRSHMRTHTNERPFQCGECGGTFSRIKSYKQHMDLHLSEKKFKCICGKTFAQSAGLYLHKKTCKKVY